LYWFALSCETGWGVMVDFNDYAQRIYLCDHYYKWMHKLRDKLMEEVPNE
jgi:predicted RNA-binding protein